MEGNRFAPQDNAARAQAATILRNSVAGAQEDVKAWTDSLLAKESCGQSAEKNAVPVRQTR